MGFMVEEQSGKVQWTYQLEDGICTDSMALTTARQYGLPSTVLSRAERLMEVFDQVCRPSSASNDSYSSPVSSVSLTPPLEREEQEISTPTIFPTVLRSTSYLPGSKDPRSSYLQQMISPLVRQFLTRYGETTSPDDPTSSKDKQEEEVEEKEDPMSRVIFIPHNHNPPPLLESQSVVYVLHIYSGLSPTALEVSHLYCII